MGQLTITPSLFYKYATCPHWIWYDLFGDPTKKGDVPALAQKLLEQGVLHEAAYIKDLKYTPVEEVVPEEAFAHTLTLMKQGVDLIYQSEIQYEADGVLYRGRPDLLEKRRGQKSTFGDYYYVPIDIKSASKIKTEHWMQLVLYAKILEEIQGVFPIDTAIINVDHERLTFSIKSKHREKTFSRISEIIRVMKGKKPPLKLSSTCKSSPWFAECVHDAKNANDIALLYKLDSRSHETLRDAGICTVVDAAAMDIDRLPKVPHASKKTLQRIKIQAESLLDDELKWIGKPRLPNTPLNIYFDIEGDPLLDVQYLWGFWVSGDPDGAYAKIGHVRHEGDKYFVYFLAEQPEDEREMWQEFLTWVALLPADGITTFHFHIYEKTQCNALAERYGSSDVLNQFMDTFIDLSDVVQKNIIFPLYFYSIKDIAKSKFLNFKWRHQKAGGAQSIFWYEKWLESGERKILNDIIDYNEDDVRATEYLHHWLATTHT